MSTKVKESIFFDDRKNAWRCDLRYDLRGEWHRKGLQAKTKKELIEKVENFKLELFKNERLFVPESISFEEYAKNWMETVQIHKIKTSSYYTKLRTMKNLVLPYVGKIPISKLTFSDVQGMVTELVKRELSYSSIKKAYEFVNACTRYYRVEKQIVYDPCEGVELPKNLEKDVADYKYLKPNERMLVEKEAYRTYKNGALVYRDGPAIMFLMYTGLRFAEFAGLTWNDIDFEEKEINVNKSSVYIDMDGEHKFIDQDSLKTKCSRRVVPMSNKAKEALEKMKTVTGDSYYILSTKHDKHVTPGNLNKTLRRILTNAGIISKGEFRGVHILRHTFATMLFESKCEVKLVSELLGHSSTKITENIYIHTIQKQKIKAINNLDIFLGK